MYKLNKIGTPLDWIVPVLIGIILLGAFLWRSFDWTSLVGILGGMLCIAFAVYCFIRNRQEERELPIRQKEFDELRKAHWEKKE